MSGQVCVIGAGLMGTAIVRKLAESFEVTAWNRRPAASEGLAEFGVTPHEQLANAVEGSDLVVICISSTADVLELVRVRGADLQGTPIVNVSTGLIEDHEAVASAFGPLGSPYIMGTILAYPSAVGTDDAMIHYAGALKVWETVSSFLVELAPTGTTYHGENLAHPVAMDVVLGGLLAIGLAGFLEGAAFATSHGVDLGVLTSSARRMLETLGDEIDSAGEQMKSGDFSTTQSTVEVWRAGVEKWRTSITNNGRQAFFMTALVRSLDHAIVHGYDQADFVSQYASNQKTAE